MALITDARWPSSDRGHGSLHTKGAVTQWQAAAGGISAGHLLQKYRKIVIASDLLAGLVAGIGSMVLRFGSEAAQSYVYISVLVPLIWVAVVATQRGYESRFSEQDRTSTAASQTPPWCFSR